MRHRKSAAGTLSTMTQLVATPSCTFATTVLVATLLDPTHTRKDARLAVPMDLLIPENTLVSVVSISLQNYLYALLVVHNLNCQQYALTDVFLLNIVFTWCHPLSPVD